MRERRVSALRVMNPDRLTPKPRNAVLKRAFGIRLVVSDVIVHRVFFRDAAAASGFAIRRCTLPIGGRSSRAKMGNGDEMNGRITRLIDDQQGGTIAGEDGEDYAFDSRSLLGVTFASLHVGASVTFVPAPATRRATVIRVS